MISSIRISSVPKVMFKSTWSAPVMSLSLSKGLSNASVTAFAARPCPEALPDPMIARPLSRMTVLTSFMSTLISPVRVMTSAMPLAAVQRIWSALANALRMVWLPNNSRSLSLRMIRSVSTAARIWSRPSVACWLRRRPSNKNGTVTMPTVKMPRSLHAWAMTGAAPVPVPPPIPAVKNAMRVSVPSRSSTSSRLSIAAFLPTSGRAPAPCPPVRVAPSCTLRGTGLMSKAWASVLQTMKSTPLMPFWNMVLTALEPPPPTPITLMGELEDCGRLKCMRWDFQEWVRRKLLKRRRRFRTKS